MDDSLQLCLTWNSFNEHVVSAFETSYGNDDFVDVTLACEGKTFGAHRLILSASSMYLKRLLKEYTHPHPLIILNNVGAEEMQDLLMYMYKGEVKVDQRRMPKLLQTANALEIRGLQDIKHTDKSYKMNYNTLTNRNFSSKNHQNDNSVLSPVQNHLPSKKQRLSHRQMETEMDDDGGSPFTVQQTPDRENNGEKSFHIKEEVFDSFEPPTPSVVSSYSIDLAQHCENGGSSSADGFGDDLQGSGRSSGTCVKDAESINSNSFLKPEMNDETSDDDVQSIFPICELNNVDSEDRNLFNQSWQESFGNSDRNHYGQNEGISSPWHQIPANIRSQMMTCREYKKFTNILLVSTFGRDVLATHTLNGIGTSKPRLDSNKVEKIIEAVVSKYGVPAHNVKEAIRIKLNNEDKLMKRRHEQS